MRVRPRGQIRSHRALRHRIVAPWIVATMATILVVVTLSAGFYLLLRKPCSGQITATIATSPSTGSLLESVARMWLEEEPVVAGRCAGVDIETKESSAMVEALGQQWDTKVNGPAPDAWVPDSSLWARRAAVNPAVSSMFSKDQPSLVRSVGVIAMPKPMADALGTAQVTWSTLVNDIVPAGWGHYGKEAWGQVRIGMTDPATSTPALMALAGIATPDANGRPPSQGVATITRLKTSSFIAASTDELTAELSKADRQGEQAALAYVSAFPALETDIIVYNQGNPAVPLVSVYPSDGSFDADHPCIVLDSTWTDAGKAEVATKFLAYARGSKAQSVYTDAGFRDADRGARGDITADNGLIEKVPVAARAIPDPEAVAQLLTAWTG
ncbi:MAG: substrate-binding domain-containing protein [Micromonosporaceae bacterium]|nr:substrate-binding domain-containing protein [Micromonosporaceae bacterium]